MNIKLDQIKLANAVKLGRSEDVLFRAQKDFRGHGTKVELVAVKMPVENARNEWITQPLVKLTDNQTGEVTYTSLMNALYFKADLGEQQVESKPRRASGVRI